MAFVHKPIIFFTTLVSGLCFICASLRNFAVIALCWGEAHKIQCKLTDLRGTNISIRSACSCIHTRGVPQGFLQASGDTKTYYQLNFPLSPWPKQSVWETHALFILTAIEGRTSPTEQAVRSSPEGGESSKLSQFVLLNKQNPLEPVSFAGSSSINQLLKKQR